MKRVVRIGRRGLARLGPGGTAFFIATALVSLSNFLFHAVVSRKLGPSEYGGLGSLLNLMTILSVPIGAAQVSVIRAVPSWVRRDAIEGELRHVLMKTSVWALAGSLVVLAFSPLLRDYLHLPSSSGLILLALWLPVAVIGNVFQGCLMGERRFRRVAAASLLGLGLGRFAFGIVLVDIRLGLAGALLASVLGQVVATVLFAWPHRSSLLSRSSEPTEGLGRQETLLSLGGMASYWILASMDVVLARHFLPARASGYYTAAATTGRIALFLPGAVAMLALPKFAAGRGRSEEARSTLRWALTVTAGIGGAGALVLVLVPQLVVQVLFGPTFIVAVPTVRLLGIEAAGLAVIGLLVYFHIASKSIYALASLVGVAAALLLTALFHGTSDQIALSMLVSVAITVGIMFVGAVNQLLSEPLMHHSVDRAAFHQGEKDGIDLTVVVPFYNPGDSLARHVRDVIGALEARKLRFEVIAVSDGSTDGSGASLATLERSDVVQLIEMPRNFGKGEALRVGLVHGRGRYLGFIDSDGDIPGSELDKFVAILGSTSPDIVTGSKRHRDSQVVYPAVRRLYSWGYQQLLRGMFNLSVRDTQTGIKLIRREVLADVLPRMVEKRFAFDLELFVVARHLGYREILELPVVIRERFTTTVSFRSVYNILLDTLGIFYRLRLLRYYDRVETQQSALGELTAVM